MDIRIKTIFTRHAIERLRECQLSLVEAIRYAEEAQEEKLPSDLRNNKNEKYRENDGIFYRRYGPFLFVTKFVIDRFTYYPILLVITITDQRATLHQYE